MNAARLARNLVADGVDRALAEPLAEHLADEIERTVATREHVEMVVTREVQQLRVEMHEEFRISRRRSANPFEEVVERFNRHWSAAEEAILQHFDQVQQDILNNLDAHFRRNMILIGLVFLTVLADILVDLLCERPNMSTIELIRLTSA